MSKWDTCKIEGVDKSGFLSTKVQCIATKTTPSGSVVIATSRVYNEWPKAYNELTEQLAGEGWETVSMDSLGRPAVMRRPISETSSQVSTKASDLLQQLANLRAAGILTEQEFQTKKSEILKRM